MHANPIPRRWYVPPSERKPANTPRPLQLNDDARARFHHEAARQIAEYHLKRIAELLAPE